MKTIKVRALRPMKQAGRPIHIGEHMRVTTDQAAELVKAGDAAYRPGDEPEPKAAAKK
ncbi:MAG: hypothetical protein ABIN44_03835 [Burkholderiaceae bacterium]